MEIKRWNLFLIVVVTLFGTLIFTYAATQGEFDSSVSVDGLSILYSDFNGTTTDFNTLGTLELNNLSNMVLEKTTYGKVVFSEIINLTQVAEADKIVDFDRDFNISDNLINTNVTGLPYLNKSVTISLYNLSFTDPQIIKGAAVCSDCTEISYSDRTLIFTSTTFSGPYYARETPTTVCGNDVCESGETTANCPEDCPEEDGGSSGGGGGAAPSVSSPEYHDFRVDPVFFSLRMNKGEYFQKYISVENNGSVAIDVYVILSGLELFMFPQQTKISLNPGENKSVRFDIYVSESRPAEIYAGKIIFKSSERRRDTDVILDIKDKDALFDINTEVLKKYITPGGRIRANVNITNMGTLRNFDVSLTYMIRDFEENNYSMKKEDFAINKTLNKVLYLDVPEEMSMGDYFFYSRVNYGEIGASSYDTFTVERVSFLTWIIVLIVLMILIYLIIRKLRDKKKVVISEKPTVKKAPLLRRIIKVPRLP